MSGSRHDPFRHQLNQLHSDGVQTAIADVKAHRRDHLSDDDLMAHHEVWRKGYEWGWTRQMITNAIDAEAANWGVSAGKAFTDAFDEALS